MSTSKISAAPLSFVLLLASAVTACSSSSPSDASEEAAADALSGGYPVGTRLVTTKAVDELRSPAAGAAVLQRIPDDAIVESASAHPVAGWYGVTYNGATGWVDGQFLARAKAGPQESSFTRQQVYGLVANRVKDGGDARDLLDPSLSTQALVDAVGWLATHTTFEWGFSVINTGHHYDPAAHSGGFAIDVFANDPVNDSRFVDIVNQDPYFVEIGVAGDYQSQQGRITSPDKCSFVEDAATHVHAAVRRAYC